MHIRFFCIHLPMFSATLFALPAGDGPSKKTSLSTWLLGFPDTYMEFQLVSLFCGWWSSYNCPFRCCSAMYKHFQAHGTVSTDISVKIPGRLSVIPAEGGSSSKIVAKCSQVRRPEHFSVVSIGYQLCQRYQ